MKNSSGFNYGLFNNLVTVLLAVTAIAGCMTYYSARSFVIASIDDRLMAGAYAVDAILGPEFHSRVSGPSSVGDAEHLSNVVKLTDFASRAGLEYIYSMVQHESGVVFTSSSATRDELEKKTYDRFFKKYEIVSDNVKKAFFDGQILFEEFQDEYGYFRSVVIPQRTPDGKVYAIGADVTMASVSARLDAALYDTAFKMFAVFFIGAGAIYIFLRRSGRAAVAAVPAAEKADGDAA